MCFAPQRRALFQYLNFPKCSDREVLLAFSLANVLPARTACNLARWLRTRFFASLLFDPPQPQIIGKAPWIATFLPFRALALSLIFSLLLFSSLTLPTSAFPSVHIVGSLTSRLPSIIPELIINQQGFWTLLMCVLICWWLLCNCNPRLCTGFALDPCLPCQALYVAWIVPGNIWSEWAQQSIVSICVYIHIYICIDMWFIYAHILNRPDFLQLIWLLHGTWGPKLEWLILAYLDQSKKRAVPCTSQIAAQSQSKDFVVSPAWFQHGSAMLGYKHVQEKKTHGYMFQRKLM